MWNTKLGNGWIEKGSFTCFTEVLSCELPSIGLNDGEHSEIIKNGGEVFESFEECLAKIDLVRENNQDYRNNISILDIDEVSNS